MNINIFICFIQYCILFFYLFQINSFDQLRHYYPHYIILCFALFRLTVLYSILYCSIQLCFILSYSTLFHCILSYCTFIYSVLFHPLPFYCIEFYSIAFHFIVLYSILSYNVLFHFLSFHSILFYSIPFYSILFYSILFYSIRPSHFLSSLTKTGTSAPEFTLPSNTGKSISLKDLAGKRTVLYFYPVRYTQ